MPDSIPLALLKEGDTVLFRGVLITAPCKVEKVTKRAVTVRSTRFDRTTGRLLSQPKASLPTIEPYAQPA